MNQKTKSICSGVALCAALVIAIVFLNAGVDGKSPPATSVKGTQDKVAAAAPETVPSGDKSYGKGVPQTPASLTNAAEPGGTIKMVTPADYATELDTSNSVLIQLCKPEKCASDVAVMQQLKPGFDNVKFVQMSTVDNAEFANRLEKEQAVLIKKDSTFKPLAYPVYVFKGADLQIAPVTTTEELRKFVEMNVASGNAESADSADAVDSVQVEKVETKK